MDSHLTSSSPKSTYLDSVVGTLAPATESQPARFRFLALAGNAIEQPAEWEPALIEVQAPIASWESVDIRLQDHALPAYLKQLGGQPRILADWPRSGSGAYRLHIATPDAQTEMVIRIAPSKISLDAFAQLLDDLERELPAAVALALKRGGALAGIDIVPPQQTTLAAELARLKRAVLGAGDARPGLAMVLEHLGRDHFEVLATQEQWLPSERARRPPPTRLVHALVARGNLNDQGRPRRVMDARAVAVADVYENQLVQSFYEEVRLRLMRLERELIRPRQQSSQLHEDEPLAQARSLAVQLHRARGRARFLDDVNLLAHPTEHITMVLLKRPEYRAALEGYLELHRSVVVRLNDPALAAPLENLPRLYELWGTLQVVLHFTERAVEAGYRVERQRLVKRQQGGGFFVEVLSDGEPAVILVDPGRNTRITIIPQRTYRSFGRLRSMSFNQRPDIAVEVHTDDCTHVYLFDPKYKLESSAGAPPVGAAEDDEVAVPGSPKKVDIDKMHAYRDAIRDVEGRPVVQYAAILYPGPTVRYSAGVEALTADPLRAHLLHERLRAIAQNALTIA